ncbi:MAG: hypothetical protein E5W02_06920 [Mesorhizobium sp.]|nr:MAG: hypothetical protein E5W02_06920 [Mesorhizobium sp.]
MINYLMARQTPATCDNYLRLGPDAVSAPDNEFLVHLDRIGATLFRAFGAAKRSGLPAAEPEDQDWSLVAEAFTKSGGTPTEMEERTPIRLSRVCARQRRNCMQRPFRCTANLDDMSKPPCSTRL